MKLINADKLERILRRDAKRMMVRSRKNARQCRYISADWEKTRADSYTEIADFIATMQAHAKEKR